MPPKRNMPPTPSESSDDGMDMMGADLMRFANPNHAREFKAKLPAEIRDRVKALEGLDDEYKKLKLEMSREVEAIEREFLKDIAPLCARRAKIVNGEEEPTEQEIADGVKAFVEKNEEADAKALQEGKAADDAPKGVPNFWLEALMHHVIISEFISERDQEALKSISDITCDVGTDGEGDKKKEFFTITFAFRPNDFFANTTLSKKFIMERQEDDITLSHAQGTKIEWKEGKNLGVEIVTKKIKSKAKKGQVKTVSSEEPCATFFDFFKAEEEEDEEEWMALAQTLKDKIIPFATNYFTGEAPNGESDMEDEDEDEEEEEEEEEEELPVARGRGRGGYSSAPARGRGAGGRGGAAAGGDQKDCKQQ